MISKAFCSITNTLRGAFHFHIEPWLKPELLEPHSLNQDPRNSLSELCGLGNIPKPLPPNVGLGNARTSSRG